MNGLLDCQVDLWFAFAELFFGFYFSGGGDFPVRGKVPSNNKALQGGRR